ncbi:hypothetical protein [Allonocardiopsis opalescens]|uniref:Uncharacterized protein n=1 Tax=Allonocardiopsis opalescens TaxID=1144618 RepID=A0A2T0Q1Z7_9ACTN|nr:hypothetical protein [Allonocardiopsis opalescens]PRX97801.1 hypothetical protein CLV72_105151 [Allonocardiopsis opalescens]
MSDNGETDPETPFDDHTRAYTDLLLAALTASDLYPFANAIATEDGEDAYQRIRELFPAATRPRAEEQLRDSGQITLYDLDARTVLRIPADLSGERLSAIAELRLRRPRRGWTEIYWDARLNAWVVRENIGPPADGLPVGRDA